MTFRTTLQSRYRYHSLVILALLTFMGCNAEVNDPGPDIPSLVSPSDGVDDEGDAVELQWNTSARAEAYDLQVASDPEFVSLIVKDENIIGDLYLLYELPIGKTNYWRVRARNTEGVSDWSDTWSFTPSQKATIPPPPGLAFPSDSTQNMPQSVTFGWQPVEGAARYHIQVSLEENFIRRSADMESVRKTTQIINGLVPTYIYYWRVRSVNPMGYSQWSPTWRIVIEDEAW